MIKEIPCHSCGQVAHRIEVADPIEWKEKQPSKIIAHGSYSSHPDYGQLRTATIDGRELKFLRSEVVEHWPELDQLFQREDEFCF